MAADGSRTTTLPALLGGLRRSVVSVLALDGAGGTLREGHGFLCGERGDLLTDRALLRGARGARVRTGDGRDLPVRGILAEDRGGDLVRLRVGSPAAAAPPPLRPAGETPGVGERVALLCGGGEPWPGVRMGTVSAVRHVPLSGTILEITAHVAPSGAGCPVVNLRGEMVGVAKAFRLGGRELAFAVPPHRLFGRPPAAAVPLPAWRGGEAAPDGAEGARHRGLALLWAEEHGAALACFEEAVRLRPGDGESWFRAALCLEALGRCGEATRACGRAAAADPRLFEAQALLGDLLSREGRHGGAAEARARAARLRPDDAGARFFLGESLERLHRMAEAALSYREAVRLDPAFVVAWYRLGEVLSLLGRHAEEAEAFRRVTELRPRMAVAHNNLGFALFRLGRLEEAVDAYREAVRVAPDFAVAHDNLGFAWYSLGRHEEAVRAYGEAIRVMPDFAEARNNLGAALAAWGRLPEAADAYRHAVRIRPDFAEAWYNLGAVLSAMGRHEEALRPLLSAVRSRPGYGEAHFALAVACLRLRRRGEALEQLRLLRSLDPLLAERLRRLLSPRPR